MDASLITDGLNDRQREAVTGPLGNSLVIAGAGSGKTRVLVRRMAWLVTQEHVSPYAILAVTFTNKAAAEMRARIEELLDIPARSLWVGTFHGIGHRLLRAHWREAGLPQNFEILDSDDQLRMIKRVMRNQGLDEQKWAPRQAQWFINAQKDEGKRASEIVPGEDLYLLTHKKIYEAYEALCNTGGMVDFAEILLRSHELWINNHDLLKHYQGRFEHILVDEFQDTNTIQYAWLRVLAGKQSHIMAVGDDDQSIYGWRGARIENIHKFQKDFDSVSSVRLEQNYRSTGTILKAANTLIKNNNDRMGKELWTSGGDGEPILTYSGYNEIDEARFIVERIRKWIDEGGSPDDCAILYRSNAQSRVLEEALLRAQLPYRIYGGQRFFERLEIKNVLAYLRLILSRDSDSAFERVINTPTRGIGEKSVQVLRTLARDQSISMWRAAKLALAEGLVKGRSQSAIAGFITLIDDLTQSSERLSLGELAEHCIEVSGLMAFHSKETGERGLARKENLEELINACRQFNGETMLPMLLPDTEVEVERTELEQFMDQAALESGEGQADSTEKCVQLMTLHSAKGLEFPLVFLSGMEEGLFPHRMSMDDPVRLEEERRLCYVGITRARKQLYLTHAEVRRLFGSESYNRPSRFVTELPSELLQEVRASGAAGIVNRGATAGSHGLGRGQVVRGRTSTIGPKPTDPKADSGELKMGQRVKHKKFGEGVVLQCEGKGDRSRVEINFNLAGPKWLMLGFAKLELLNG
ncbi:MAG: DNA helicase II [Pseudomonadales bacterium]|nr:DNA helicase II [Pseudomonadales bacterium]